MPDSIIPTLPAQALQHPLVRRISTLAEEAGGAARLVGGAVRDLLLGEPLPLDLDFMLTDCRAEALMERLAECGGHPVPLDPAFGIYRVVFDGGLNVDLAEALDNCVQTDLSRRDLTVNAMAMDLETGLLIDPLNGKADLEARRIRMVSASNLLDDPLRLLRIFRIGATIRAKHWDAETLAVAAREREALWQVAAERIQYELFRLLDAPQCFPALQKMADSGLLETVIPDLTPMKTIGPSGYHHLNLFEHTLELVRQTERLIEECPAQTQEDLAQKPIPAISRLGLVKMACILHDIGKPATMGEREDPVHGRRLTFYGHEEVGEQMADPLLKRLKVGNDIRAYLKKLVRWHLYPCQFGPESPRKSVLRYFRRMGEETPDVTLLALADRHSACGDWLDPEALAASHQAHLWLMAQYYQERPVLSMPRLLNGHDVMRILDSGPGPHLKEILEALSEVQQLNEVSTPTEAEAWVRKHYTSPHPASSRKGEEISE